MLITLETLKVKVDFKVMCYLNVT